MQECVPTLRRGHSGDLARQRRSDFVLEHAVQGQIRVFLEFGRLGVLVDVARSLALVDVHVGLVLPDESRLIPPCSCSSSAFHLAHHLPALLLEDVAVFGIHRVPWR